MISIITPVCGDHLQFLPETFASINDQLYHDREWLVMPNHGATKKDIEKVIKLPNGKAPFNVRIIEPPEDYPDHIGALKRTLCENAKGEIILELDDDDLLHEDCLDDVDNAFYDHPDIKFVYSNSAQFEHETWKNHFYSPVFGWKKREHWYKGHKLWEMIAFPPSPHMMRYVFWAPNHVRAWKKDAYFDVGGHARTLAIGDDHDLCCQFYLRYGDKGFKHLDKCLYYYRKHKTNHCMTDNKAVQQQTRANYHKYILGLAVKWAKDKNLRCVELGSRRESEVFETWDLYHPNPGYATDLNEDWVWAKDNSVGVVLATNVLEHLNDPVHTMNEIYRVLAPGGWAFIVVPSTDGRGAFQDPTHKSFWNLNSFWYYTDKIYAEYIKPQFKGRFQVSMIDQGFLNREHGILMIEAHLIALKPGYHPIGEVKI